MIHALISGRHSAGGMQEFHEKGKRLDDVLVGLKDANKLKRYLSAVKAYEKFVSKQRGVSWFKPASAIWSYGGLNVRVLFDDNEC